MDTAKKSTKKTFSVPIVKKKEGDPDGSKTVPQAKDKSIASKKFDKENSKPDDKPEKKKKTKATLPAEAKEKKPTTKKEVKTDSKDKQRKPSRSTVKKTMRPLTDAEYKDIFEAAINPASSPHQSDNDDDDEEDDDDDKVCDKADLSLSQEDEATEPQKITVSADDHNTTDSETIVVSEKGEQLEVERESGDEIAAKEVNPPDKEKPVKAENLNEGQEDSFVPSEKKKKVKGVKENDTKTKTTTTSKDKLKEKVEKEKTNGEKEVEIDGSKTKKKNTKNLKDEEDKCVENKKKKKEDNTKVSDKENQPKKKDKTKTTEKEEKEQENEGKTVSGKHNKDGKQDNEKQPEENREVYASTESDKEANVEEKKDKLASNEADESDEECKKEEEKDDVASVVSEESISSSMREIAMEVDQWDRPGEVQHSNERTPKGSEAEAEPHAETPSVIHKPKKIRQRKNQLAPRKLCFDSPAEQKTSAKTLPKKKDKSKDLLASVPEFKKKKKSFKKAIKEDEDEKKQQKKEEADTLDVLAEKGTWVQCSEDSCKKWRYLPNIHDPAEVHDVWVCSMHPDPAFNGCDKAEEEYDESDHILTEYTLGSLVWAKMDGFPWWPGIVDTDPDYDVYCEIPHEDCMVPSDYHVVFLDEKVTRCWVRKSRIQHLLPSHLAVGSVYMRGHKYKKEIGAAMRKAETALDMPLQERLDAFGFKACFKNLSTRWTKALAKKKQPKHKRDLKKTERNGTSKKEAPAATKAKHAAVSSDSESDSDLDTPNAGYSPDDDLSAQSSDNNTDGHVHHKQKKLSKKAVKKRVSDSSPTDKKDHGHSSKESKKMAKSERGGTHEKRKIAHRDHGDLKVKNVKFRTPVTAKFEETSDSCHDVNISFEKDPKDNDEEIPLQTSSDEDDEEIPVKGDTTVQTTDDISSKKATKKFTKGKELDSVKHSSEEEASAEEVISDKMSSGNGEMQVSNSKKKHAKSDGESEIKPVKEKEKSKATKVKKAESVKENTVPTSSTETGKKKKLFKSEMAKQRDAAVKLQAEQKEDSNESSASDVAEVETKVKTSKKRKAVDDPKGEKGQTGKKKIKLIKDNQNTKEKSAPKKTKREGNSSEQTPKSKSQKFVAPVRPQKETSVPKQKTVASENESLKAIDKAADLVADKENEIAKYSPKATENEQPSKAKKPKGAFSDQTSTKLAIEEQAKKSLLEPDSDDNVSPMLSSKNKDQFVPSITSDDEEETLDQEMVLDDGDLKPKAVKEKVKDVKGFAESDSDCLDIEEDLPIPSLQQVLSVEGKGFSDQEGFDSDPLEMAET
ncbi:myb-like protein X [Littorina saxatilis]|uniref:Uncharacterized protein n=1 Tax=Littorina saxatilis TaxID=31220 RepID=A0AAN9AVX2_9CAEN